MQRGNNSEHYHLTGGIWIAANAPTPAASVITTTRAITCAYDPLGRLVEADYSTPSTGSGQAGESFEYAYNAVGNRKTLTSTTPLSDTLVTTYTYDGAGQMVEATVFTLTTRFTYTFASLSAGNGLGARVAVEVVGQGATTYTLDYAADNVQKLGRLLPSRNAGGISARILAETTGAGSTLYLYGRDCLGELRDDDWLHYLSDAEGLVRQGVNEQGQVVSNWLFDPDGTVLEGPEGPVSHLVCGSVYDWSTRLIYKDGRYFDPLLGIWLTMLPGMIKTPLDRSGVFGQSMALLVEPYNNRSRVTRGSMITSSFSKSSLKRHFCIVVAPMMSCCDRSGMTINSSEKR